MSTGSTVTDEAVESVVRSLHPGLFEEDGLLHPMLANSGRWDARHKVRAALEAALPHLAPQPVDREALTFAQAIRSDLADWTEDECRKFLRQFADAMLAPMNGRQS